MSRDLPPHRLLSTVVMALSLAACGPAGDGDTDAAGEDPVTMEAGRWQFLPQGKLADSLYLGGDRALCLSAGGADALLKAVMDDLARKEMGDDVGSCTSSGLKRTGNFVTNRVNCSFAGRGSIAADVRSIVRRDRVDVTYDVDLSDLHDPETDLAKARAVMRNDPPHLTLRRTGACTGT